MSEHELLEVWDDGLRAADNGRTTGSRDHVRGALRAVEAAVRADQIEKDAAIAEGGIDPVVDRELGARWQRGKIAALIRAQLTERTDQ